MCHSLKICAPGEEEDSAIGNEEGITSIGAVLGKLLVHAPHVEVDGEAVTVPLLAVVLRVPHLLENDLVLHHSVRRRNVVALRLEEHGDALNLGAPLLGADDILTCEHCVSVCLPARALRTKSVIGASVAELVFVTRRRVDLRDE